MSWESIDGWVITVSSILFFTFEILGLLSIVHALRTVRTAQATTAWCVGLLTLPVVVLPLYWIFGRSRFFGYREALRKALREHREPLADYQQYLDRVIDPEHCTSLPLHEVARVVGQNVTFGNALKPLIDGEETFATMFAAMRRARKYLLVQFYIIRSDFLGEEFANILIERAEAGVEVRLLFDDIGCQWLPQWYIDRLRKAGVVVTSFNTRERWRQRLQINFRNHRKVVIVDGEIAFTGGLNIGDEYRGLGQHFRHWRDTHLVAQGPVVQAIQSAFVQDWYWANHELLSNLIWNPEHPPQQPESCPTDPDGQAVVIPTGPADKYQQCSMMFCQMAAVARQRLWIATPYFVPDDAVSVALQTAARRGVDVKILVPRNGDHWLTHMAGHFYEAEHTRLGMHLLRYQQGFMHQKAILVDDQIAAIGSTNLDNRSLHLNFEIMVASSDRQFIQAVEKMLLADLERSRALDINYLSSRPFLFQLGVGFARLLAPIL